MAAERLYASKSAMLRVKLQNLDQGKWSEMTDHDRIVYIGAVIRLWCDVHCAKNPVTVLIDYLGLDANNNGTAVQLEDAIPDLHGFYRDPIRTLFINKLDLPDMAELLDTVGHELRHAFQKDQVREMDAGRAHHPDSPKWKLDFANPVHHKKDEVGYWNMEIERDAREYAQRFAKDPVI